MGIGRYAADFKFRQMNPVAIAIAIGSETFQNSVSSRKTRDYTSIHTYLSRDWKRRSVFIPAENHQEINEFQ